jgi:hypothetical protein
MILELLYQISTEKSSVFCEIPKIISVKNKKRGRARENKEGNEIFSDIFMNPIDFIVLMCYN